MSATQQPSEQQGGLVYHKVYRTLAEPTYLIRFWLFRLRDFDVLMCLVLAFGIWFFIDTFKMGKEYMWIFRVDPWSYVLSSTLLAVIMSIANRIRPFGGLEPIARGLIAPKLFTPRTDRRDRVWHPTQRPVLLCREWPEDES